MHQNRIVRRFLEFLFYINKTGHKKALGSGTRNPDYESSIMRENLVEIQARSNRANFEEFRLIPRSVITSRLRPLPVTPHYPSVSTTKTEEWVKLDAAVLSVWTGSSN